MPDPTTPESQPATEPEESFGDLLSQFEKSHAPQGERKQIEGTVIAISAESVFLDIGYKSEGILPLTAFPAGQLPKAGDKLLVSVKGRDPEGYYELSRTRI